MAKIAKKYIRLASPSPDRSRGDREEVVLANKGGKKKNERADKGKGKKDAERKRAKVVYEVRRGRRGDVVVAPRARFRLPFRLGQRLRGTSSHPGVPTRSTKRPKINLHLKNATKTLPILPGRSRSRWPRKDTILSVKLIQNSRIHSTVHLTTNLSTIKITKTTRYADLFASLLHQAAAVAVGRDVHPEDLKGHILIKCWGNMCPLLEKNWKIVSCLMFLEKARLEFSFQIWRGYRRRRVGQPVEVPGESEEEKECKGLRKMGRMITSLARRS